MMTNQKNDSTLLELAIKDYEGGQDIEAVAYTLDMTPDQFLSLYLKRKRGFDSSKKDGFPTLRLALENAKKVEDVKENQRQVLKSPVRLSWTQKEEVYELIKQGVKQREIAETYGIGVSTLHKIRKAVEESRAYQKPKAPEVHAPSLPVETLKPEEGIKILMTETHVNISIPRKDFIRSLLKDLL